MKILKIILLIVLLIIIAFFLIGLVKPTVSYGHEITVNKPLNEAWAVQQDESKFNQWLEGFQSINLIEGKKGEVGSKYKIIVKPEGQPDFEMIETLQSIKEMDHITLQMDSDMMIFDQTTSFKENGGKVVIKTDSKVTGKGLTMKSMFALMEMFGGMFQKQEEKNIEALKTVIESNTTNYFPVEIIENSEGEVIQE